MVKEEKEIKLGKGKKARKEKRKTEIREGKKIIIRIQQKFVLQKLCISIPRYIDYILLTNYLRETLIISPWSKY